MPFGPQAFTHDGAGQPFLTPAAEDALDRKRADLTHRVDFLRDYLGDNDALAEQVARALASGDGDGLLATFRQGLAAYAEEAITRAQRRGPYRRDELDALDWLLATYTEELPTTLSDAVAPILDRYEAGGYRPDGVA